MNCGGSGKVPYTPPDSFEAAHNNYKRCPGCKGCWCIYCHGKGEIMQFDGGKRTCGSAWSGSKHLDHCNGTGFKHK